MCSSDLATTKVEFLVGNLVAAGTDAQTFIEVFVLEMAQKAGRRRHCHVGALDDLAVATGAA